MDNMAIFDISQLADQNPWWIDKQNIERDAKIKGLNEVEYQWDPHIKHYIGLDHDVIYSIRGPRQVGKTTLVKMVIRALLFERGIPPENIFFWSLERNTKDDLNKLVDTYLNWKLPTDDRRYIFLDEISSIENWARELTYFANSNRFENCTVVVTGSHAMDMKHSTELMPGRRGGVDDEPLDKILMPMKFSEFVGLLNPNIKKRIFDLEVANTKRRQDMILNLFSGTIDQTLDDLHILKTELDGLLDLYLLTGGLPSVINELKMNGKISTRLYNVYLTAILGDLNRFRYKDIFFKQIMREIYKVLSNPITYNSFTESTEIRSHNTVQEYILALEELYIANVSYKISIHDGKIKTSNNKKIYILDPFIFHALHGWANNRRDYFGNAKSNLLNTEFKSQLMECVVYNHLCRFAYGLNPRDLFDPKDAICYYRDKKQKEIDFILRFDERYYPFELKYQSTISNSDFFNFRSFGKGVLITRNDMGKHRNYVKIPVSLLLLLI